MEEERCFEREENRDADWRGLLKEIASRGRGGLYLSQMAISQNVAAEAQLVVIGQWWLPVPGLRPRKVAGTKTLGSRGRLDRQIRNF